MRILRAKQRPVLWSTSYDDGKPMTHKIGSHTPDLYADRRPNRYTHVELTDRPAETDPGFTVGEYAEESLRRQTESSGLSE